MLLSTYIGLIVRPIHTIQQIVVDRPVGLGLLTLFGVALVGTLVGVGTGFDPKEASNEDVQFPDISFGLVVSMSIVITLWVIPVFALLSLIPHVLARLFGGSGAYAGFLSGAAMIPVISLISTAVSAVLALALRTDGLEGTGSAVSSVVSLVVAIWMIVLTVLLIRENYRLTTGMAILTFLVTALIGAVAALILGAILGMLLLLVFLIFGLTFA